MAKQYHLIGIGGIGMSGIAQLLLKRGDRVSGSDVKDGQLLEDLRRQGAAICIGHASANINGADVVVYSSAIREQNPELAAARQNGIPVLKRGQALAELMQDKKVITVTGSHGKTTTTSLISYMLLEAALSPTIAIGGTLKNIQSNASAGEGEYFVAEADESDGSFLYYRPLYSIITNIDREHLDYYRDFKNELKAFKSFISQTSPQGCAILCGDDEHLRDIGRDLAMKRVMFGLQKEHADIYAQNVRMAGLSSSFDVFYGDTPVARFDLALGGLHNVSNSLAVIALGLELGVAVETIRKVLASYKGAGRRLDVRLQDERVTVIDDYGHHPTEIKATLAAVRNMAAKRVRAVFQPHRFSRTQLLLEEFGACFSDADDVVITDIYSAGEEEIPGISGQSVVEAVRRLDPGRSVSYVPRQQLVQYLAATITAGDVLVMLGAGDIVKLSHELVETIKPGNPA